MIGIPATQIRVPFTLTFIMTQTREVFCRHLNMIFPLFFESDGFGLIQKSNRLSSPGKSPNEFLLKFRWKSNFSRRFSRILNLEFQTEPLPTYVICFWLITTAQPREQSVWSNVKTASHETIKGDWGFRLKMCQKKKFVKNFAKIAFPTELKTKIFDLICFDLFF